MNEVLRRWNSLPSGKAVMEILPACGSMAWSRGMAALRPLADEASLLMAGDQVWCALDESDWMEAFQSHPRIGESSPQSAAQQSMVWSAQEQRNVSTADDIVKSALAEANREYEQRFHRIFIVCASGKSTTEILGILRRRLQNNDEAELHEAAEQQRQITNIRLKKWLSG
ncbi:MAG: 2-oxo-4-hydroxy-4-carboxy-5-ureidoimidazoline decarboxylase [Terriglobales bacterium]|jgi:2-oxo-4-hydroxy-4-carboxy-5-ureidoimidazoline decarboxylase